jgi:hypothetical protein
MHLLRNTPLLQYWQTMHNSHGTLNRTLTRPSRALVAKRDGHLQSLSTVPVFERSFITYIYFPTLSKRLCNDNDVFSVPALYLLPLLNAQFDQRDQDHQLTTERRPLLLLLLLLFFLRLKLLLPLQTIKVRE